MRFRRAGDTIWPLGAPGEKKLKDYYIDKKVDRQVRGFLPVAARGSRVLWALGVGVALEFTGPLAIAMLGSRRLIDFLWIALAVGGLLLLLPIHEFSGNLDPVGVAFALGAGFCWAMYIFFGKRAGNAGGGASVSLGMIVGACAILPFGVASAGTSMFSMSVLPLALLLGVFSSALPYGLEIVALKQLPAQTFGILMSMEPVLAALSGIIFLGEQLNVAQWVALACIIVASIGATLTIRRKA